jgi:hypothetical protein
MTLHLHHIKNYINEYFKYFLFPNNNNQLFFFILFFLPTITVISSIISFFAVSVIATLIILRLRRRRENMVPQYLYEEPDTIIEGQKLLNTTGVSINNDAEV